MPVPSQENDGCPMSVVLWVKVLLCLSFVLCFFFYFSGHSFVFTFIVQTYKLVWFYVHIDNIIAPAPTIVSDKIKRCYTKLRNENETKRNEVSQNETKYVKQSIKDPKTISEGVKINEILSG
jgi:hypothetical protein